MSTSSWTCRPCENEGISLDHADHGQGRASIGEVGALKLALHTAGLTYVYKNEVLAGRSLEKRETSKTSEKVSDRTQPGVREQVNGLLKACRLEAERGCYEKAIEPGLGSLRHGSRRWSVADPLVYKMHLLDGEMTKIKDYYVHWAARGALRTWVHWHGAAFCNSVSGQIIGEPGQPPGPNGCWQGPVRERLARRAAACRCGRTARAFLRPRKQMTYAARPNSRAAGLLLQLLALHRQACLRRVSCRPA